MQLLLECLWHEAVVAINTLRLVVFLPVSVSFWFLAREEEKKFENVRHSSPAVAFTQPNCKLLFCQEQVFLMNVRSNNKDWVKPECLFRWSGKQAHCVRDLLFALINANCVSVCQLLKDPLPIYYSLNWKRNIVEWQWPHSLTEWKPQLAIKLGLTLCQTRRSQRGVGGGECVWVDCCWLDRWCFKGYFSRVSILTAWILVCQAQSSKHSAGSCLCNHHVILNLNPIKKYFWTGFKSQKQEKNNRVIDSQQLKLWPPNKLSNDAHLETIQQ